MNVLNLDKAVEKYMINIDSKIIKRIPVGYEVIDLSNDSDKLKRLRIMFALKKGIKIKTGIFNNTKVLLK